MEELAEAQKTIHTWGEGNQVQFDPGKEHFVVLSRVCPCGHAFKLLGALIDPKLIMDAEVERVLKKASPKIKTILRTRKYYGVHGLVEQYKTHVLCIIEGTNGSYFHAATTHLNKLDMLQTKFL